MNDKPKVLVVDDRQENLLTVRAVIEELEIEILEAGSGEDALRLLLVHDFAVILLDVEMPGTDGFATARIIRNRRKTRHTPIIFLTAVDRGEAAIQQGYALGAIDYIIKPFVPEVLRWKVSVFADLYSKSVQTQQLLREQAARKEWESSAKRSALLADLTSMLVSSNYESTLDRLPELVVPDFADWACIFRMETHANELQQLIHNGSPVLLNFTGKPLLERLGISDRGPGSTMIIPLMGKNGAVGALAAFRSAPNQFTATDRLFAKDIAERASLAITNSQLFEEAEAASRAKDQFLAVVSHELRTPLNAITGWVQILRTKELDSTAKSKAFQTIEQNARLQDELIGDILDISRIVAGKLSVTFADIDLDSIVHKTMDALKPTADAKGVELRTEIDPDVPIVAGDSKRLQQVLWNLVANAVKFTPAQGWVEVRVRTGQGHLRIEVHDSGAGIRSELLNRVFEPFIQGDSSLKRSYGGLGLGLAITRHLVELHGGSVKAESPGEGKGSVFTVLLPLRRALRAS